MKKTLELSDEKAKQLYPAAQKEFKELLEANWGKDFFSERITDKVKTFSDACKVVGLNEKYFLHAVQSLDIDTQAYEKLKVIVKVLNEGWQPDWKNTNQYKYIPWFEMNGRSGFSFHGGRWVACSGVGSRLCFKTRELAEYAGKRFLDIYKEHLVID